MTPTPFLISRRRAAYWRRASMRGFDSLAPALLGSIAAALCLLALLFQLHR